MVHHVVKHLAAVAVATAAVALAPAVANAATDNASASAVPAHAAAPAAAAWIRRCGGDACMILSGDNAANTTLTIFYAANTYGFTGHFRVLGPKGARAVSATRFWPAHGLSKAFPSYWTANFSAKAGWTFCTTGWRVISGLVVRNGRVCVTTP